MKIKVEKISEEEIEFKKLLNHEYDQTIKISFADEFKFDLTEEEAQELTKKLIRTVYCYGIPEKYLPKIEDLIE